MDTFEFSESPLPKRKKKTSALVWNVLTILVLVTILCVVSLIFLIYMDPNTNINPFPPPTLYPSIAAPTFTVTPRFTLVPSWTATLVNPVVVNLPQATAIPSQTSVPVDAPEAESQAATPAPSDFAFVAQEGSPSAIAWTTFHPDAGCEWSGVAGQATSLNGEGVRGLFVQLGGSMLGVDSVDKLAMTGLASEYGAGGYEFTLSNSLVDSSGSLWVQLLDQQNLPVSDRIYFDTFADCEKNLVIIYFEQVR